MYNVLQEEEIMKKLSIIALILFSFAVFSCASTKDLVKHDDFADTQIGEKTADVIEAVPKPFGYLLDFSYYTDIFLRLVP